MPALGLYEVLDGFENELELERELGVRAFEFNRELLVNEVGSIRVGVGSTRVGVGSTRVLGSDRVGLGSDRVGLGSDRVGLGSNRVGLGSDRAEVAKTLKDPNKTLTDPNQTLIDPKPLTDPKLTLVDPNKTLTDSNRTLIDPKTLVDPNPTLIDPNPPLGPYDFVFLHHDRLSQGGVEMMAKIVTAMKKTPDTAPIVFVGERPAARVYVVLGGIAMKKWFPELRCSPGQWAKGARGEEVLVTYSPEYILRLGPETPAVKKLKLAMWTSLKGVMQKS